MGAWEEGQRRGLWTKGQGALMFWALYLKNGFFEADDFMVHKICRSSWKS